MNPFLSFSLFLLLRRRGKTVCQAKISSWHFCRKKETRPFRFLIKFIFDKFFPGKRCVFIINILWSEKSFLLSPPVSPGKYIFFFFKICLSQEYYFRYLFPIFFRVRAPRQKWNENWICRAVTILDCFGCFPCDLEKIIDFLGRQKKSLGDCSLFQGSHFVTFYWWQIHFSSAITILIPNPNRLKSHLRDRYRILEDELEALFLNVLCFHVRKKAGQENYSPKMFYCLLLFSFHRSHTHTHTYNIVIGLDPLHHTTISATHLQLSKPTEKSNPYMESNDTCRGN